MMPLYVMISSSLAVGECEQISERFFMFFIWNVSVCREPMWCWPPKALLPDRDCLPVPPVSPYVALPPLVRDEKNLGNHLTTRPRSAGAEAAMMARFVSTAE